MQQSNDLKAEWLSDRRQVDQCPKSKNPDLKGSHLISKEYTFYYQLTFC